MIFTETPIAGSWLIDLEQVPDPRRFFVRPAASAGVRFDDPTLAIPWPLTVTIISPRDLCFPALPTAVGGAVPTR